MVYPILYVMYPSARWRHEDLPTDQMEGVLFFCSMHSEFCGSYILRLIELLSKKGCDYGNHFFPISTMLEEWLKNKKALFEIVSYRISKPAGKTSQHFISLVVILLLTVWDKSNWIKNKGKNLQVVLL